MKKNFLVNLVLLAIIALSVSSCFDMGSDLDALEQTKGEEIYILNNYIDSLIAHGHDVDTTDLGVYYITIEEGEGDYPSEGDSLTVGYTGYYINGYVFDSSEIHYADGKWEFVLGDPPMIPGWDNGIKQVKEGGKIQFIVPSELAYGEEGHGNVGPNQTLVFVVRLFDLKQSE